jgi:DNA topoisomerase IB
VIGKSSKRLENYRFVRRCELLVDDDSKASITLQKHVDRIRKDYTADLKSKIMADRQRATAMYLIDKLALRAGNEKGEDEADTVGCCSLRLEHVTLLPKDEENPADRIQLSFLGKDSILYEQVVEVDPQVFKNIKIFKAEPKTQEDDLFDRLTVSRPCLNLQLCASADCRSVRSDRHP